MCGIIESDMSGGWLRVLGVGYLLHLVGAAINPHKTTQHLLSPTSQMYHKNLFMQGGG
jgi:hypothetical protein